MGKLPAINLGERLTRISRPHIETMFVPLAVVPTVPEVQPKKMDYSQAECYTSDMLNFCSATAYRTVSLARVSKNAPARWIRYKTLKSTYALYRLMPK
jgi:hypothetical protein